MNINKLDTKGWWAVRRYNADGTWQDANPLPIYTPATPCKVEHSNIAGSDSGRDETGYMHIDWVRRDVRKVFLTYKAITPAEVAYMENLMQGKEFQFTFRDKGAVQTMKAYVGESSYEFYSYADGVGEFYTNFSMNVIEL